jgi:catalase
MMEGQPAQSKGRKVAILSADNVSAEQVAALTKALEAAGAKGEVVGTHLGQLAGKDGTAVKATKTFANSGSVMFDAVFVPGGAEHIAALLQQGDARQFIDEAYKHGKPIGAVAEGVDLLAATGMGRLLDPQGVAPGKLAGYGVIIGKGTGLKKVADQFVAALTQHRFVNRTEVDQISA